MQLSNLTEQDPAFRGLVGTGRHDMTPEPGIYCHMWGSATHDQAESIHRPLYATAICLQNDGQKCQWPSDATERGQRAQAIRLVADQRAADLIHSFRGAKALAFCQRRPEHVCRPSGLAGRCDRASQLSLVAANRYGKGIGKRARVAGRLPHDRARGPR
jgi:hypothetical protein